MNQFRKTVAQKQFFDKYINENNKDDNNYEDVISYIFLVFHLIYIIFSYWQSHIKSGQYHSEINEFTSSKNPLDSIRFDLSLYDQPLKYVQKQIFDLLSACFYNSTRINLINDQEDDSMDSSQSKNDQLSSFFDFQVTNETLTFLQNYENSSGFCGELKRFINFIFVIFYIISIFFIFLAS